MVANRKSNAADCETWQHGNGLLRPRCHGKMEALEAPPHAVTSHSLIPMPTLVTVGGQRPGRPLWHAGKRTQTLLSLQTSVAGCREKATDRHTQLVFACVRHQQHRRASVGSSVDRHRRMCVARPPGGLRSLAPPFRRSRMPRLERLLMADGGVVCLQQWVRSRRRRARTQKSLSCPSSRIAIVGPMAPSSRVKSCRAESSRPESSRVESSRVEIVCVCVRDLEGDEGTQRGRMCRLGFPGNGPGAGCGRYAGLSGRAAMRGWRRQKSPCFDSAAGGHLSLALEKWRELNNLVLFPASHG